MSETPKLRDLLGAAPNLTGGLSSEEYIRRNRARADPTPSAAVAPTGGETITRYDLCCGEESAWLEPGPTGAYVLFEDVRAALSSPVRAEPIDAGTWRTMYEAWRKRAEEAERELMALQPSAASPLSSPLSPLSPEQRAALADFTATMQNEVIPALVAKRRRAGVRAALSSPVRAEPDEEDEDADYWALEVLCRVFEDGADEGMEEWRAWYKPEEWLSPARALGCFISRRVRARQAVRAERGEAERLRQAVDVLRDRVACSATQDGAAPKLRDALIGFNIDPVFYTRWERNRVALVDVLDALDAALTPTPPATPTEPTDA